MVVASLYVFGTVLPWNSIEGGPPTIPMVVYLTLSMILFSLLTAQMSGPGVPRPSYGRMFAIFLGTGGLTALLLLFSRDYFSRLFLITTAVSWLVLATAHRMVRRRRPWTERIALITGEKQLAEDLIDSPHAEVVWVLDPKSESVPDLPERDVTMAVDLKVVLSERVAQFLSSSDVAGYTIRPFTSTYEEHTGRVPLVHLAEGWEISAPLLEVAPWLPGQKSGRDACHCHHGAYLGHSQPHRCGLSTAVIVGPRVVPAGEGGVGRSPLHHVQVQDHGPRRREGRAQLRQ